MDTLLSLDYHLFQTINSLTNRWQILDWVGIFFAKYLIWVIVAIFLIWWLNLAKTKTSDNWPVEGKRKWLIFGSVSLPAVLSILINQLLAIIHFRDRPFLNLNIQKLVEPFSEKSFPSDHSAIAFAISMAVFFYNKKLSVILFFLSFLVSVGRIFAGVHYPLDIVAGSMVGIIMAIVIRCLLKEMIKRKKEIKK